MENGKIPRISVIIPVHGEAPFLPLTIESIQNQSNQDFEIVIVLDRPSKGVESYANQLRTTSVKVKTLYSESAGISNALNHGIANSQSEYIARIDADDLMHRERLKIQGTFLDTNHDVVCVGSQVLRIDEHGQFIGRSTYPRSTKQIATTLLFRNCMAHPSVMYRRSAINKSGGYRTQFDGAEDYDLWLRMLYFGNISNINSCLTSYRIWNKQFTSGNKEKIRIIADHIRSEHKISPDMPKPQFQENDLNIFQLKDKYVQWLVAAKHFNIAVEKIRKPGQRFSAIINFVKSFLVLPLLSIQIYVGYVLRAAYFKFKGDE